MVDTATSWCQLDGKRVTSGVVTIPTNNIWSAELSLAESALPSTNCVLTVGNLSLVGTVVRQAAFAGVVRTKLVGGAGGWRKAVDSQQYSNSVGVSAKMVLNDLAKAVGETLSWASDINLGNTWTRQAAQAVYNLKLIAGQNWHVKPDGATTLDAWDSSAISSQLMVINATGSEGRFQIATEDMASWLPGRTFVSPTVTEAQSIATVQHFIENEGKVRLEVLTKDGNTDRLLDSLRQLIRLEFPQLAYMATWEFTVINVHSDGSLDLIPVSPSCPIPTLSSVPPRASIPGMVVKPQTGSTCLVCFIDANPKRPYILAYDSQMPDSMELAGLGPSLELARNLDQAGPFAVMTPAMTATGRYKAKA